MKQPFHQSSVPKIAFIIVEERVDEYLGVEYLVAGLSRQGISSKTFQWAMASARTEIEELLKQQKELRIVGIPWLYIFSEPRVVEVAQWIKALRPDVKIVVGGHPVTFEFDRVLHSYPEIDFVVRGEGDEIIIGLLASVYEDRNLTEVDGIAFRDAKDNIVATSPRAQIQDVDSLPFPSRTTLEQVIKHYDHPQKLLVRMIGSRGCYARCEFCSMVSFYSLNGQGMSWRPRSPENIVNEISGLVNLYGVRTFWFADDEFIGPPKIGVPRILKLATLLRQRHLDIEFGFDARANGICKFSIDQLELLREAGLRVVAMGLESGSQAALRRMNKGMDVESNWDAIRRLRAAGIEYRYGFIMYDPQTSFDDLRDNIKFLSFAEPHKICNTGPYRLLNAEFPEVGTPFFLRLGKQTHDVNVNEVQDFTRVDELELGYSFTDQRVSRYRHLLKRLASEVVEPVMIPRAKNEPQLGADVWFGINNASLNIAAMQAFLGCHTWLLDHIVEDLDDEQILSVLSLRFQQEFGQLVGTVSS